MSPRTIAVSSQNMTAPVIPANSSGVARFGARATVNTTSTISASSSAGAQATRSTPAMPASAAPAALAM
jgi:hypothetical protein